MSVEHHAVRRAPKHYAVAAASCRRITMSRQHGGHRIPPDALGRRGRARGVEPTRAAGDDRWHAFDPHLAEVRSRGFGPLLVGVHTSSRGSIWSGASRPRPRRGRGIQALSRSGRQSRRWSASGLYSRPFAVMRRPRVRHQGAAIRQLFGVPTAFAERRPVSHRHLRILAVYTETFRGTLHSGPIQTVRDRRSAASAISI